MDDLASVQWTAPKAPSVSQPQAVGNYSSFPSLRPTPPLSGRSTPSNVVLGQKLPASPGFGRNSATIPANDSFANLVSFNAPQQNARNLSLQEQQILRQENMARQEIENRRAFDARVGSTQAAARDESVNGSSPSSRVISPPTYTATDEYGGQKLSKIINRPFAGIPAQPMDKRSEEAEDDLLAAFAAEAPVNKSSYMDSVETVMSKVSLEGKEEDNGGLLEDSDDDPFGLGIKRPRSKPKLQHITNSVAGDDDNDVLGLLGRPVSEFSKKQSRDSGISEPVNDDPVKLEIHPQERAISELVDMGFSADKSKMALESTESGVNVQAAVGWLLAQAHEDSRKQMRSQRHGSDENEATTEKQQSRRAPGRRKSSTSGGSKPAWMRDQEQATKRTQHRPDSNSLVNGDKDPTQYASEIGNKMFKTAGSLWKTGTKKLNQAVAEFNSDSDSNQPKWMKEVQPQAEPRNVRAQAQENGHIDHDIAGVSVRRKSKNPVADVTDEALMLEADSRPPPRKSRPRPEAPRGAQDSSRDHSPVLTPQFRAQKPQPRPVRHSPARDPRSKLSRQAAEEELSQAYISPARRKKSMPKPAPVVTKQEPDLIISDSQPRSQSPPIDIPAASNSRLQLRNIPTASTPPRPLPPKRLLPSLSPFALQASTDSRRAGTAAFKRGDYAQATSCYSTSLSALPSSHPLSIPLLTNRALSHSKTGDAKASIADALTALGSIGSSRGIGETIDFGPGEGVKPMSSYWEKAMTRQAEALEQLERWSEAVVIWRTCVEAGVGGATSIEGRNRCEKAANPPLKTTIATKKPISRPRPQLSALGDMTPDSESVSRLRAANVAADRLDDEKFALADVVDGRISRWRSGKEGNLRALLSTLESVLWEDSGWRKVGMGDVLLPGKVKVVYMKGISKVHPDKVSRACQPRNTMMY